jgi:hypothetical protein
MNAMSPMPEVFRYSRAFLAMERGSRLYGCPVRGSMISLHDHVRGFDTFPAADGRAVEGHADLEHFIVQAAHREGEVLQLSEHISEQQVHELDVVVLGKFHDFGGGHIVFSSS